MFLNILGIINKFFGIIIGRVLKGEKIRKLFFVIKEIYKGVKIEVLL